jgi:hypothetical protein
MKVSVQPGELADEVRERFERAANLATAMVLVRRQVTEAGSAASVPARGGEPT